MVICCEKTEKKTKAPRTFRHIWLPLRTGDCFAAKRAFILPALPSPPTTLDNSLTRIAVNGKINDLKNVFLNFKEF